MKKILLVDDEDSIHLLYREELEDEGYEVHSALSGEEALEKLGIIAPDLIILDINMPGMNGIDALGLRRVHCQIFESGRIKGGGQKTPFLIPARLAALTTRPAAEKYFARAKSFSFRGRLFLYNRTLLPKHKP